MIKIAICDDDKITCACIETIILNTYRDVKVEIFYSGEKFLRSLEKVPFYDIAFLDIEMGVVDGLEVGTQIRNKLNNNVMQIVYISAKSEYAMELFKIRPFDFLIKPIISEDILATIDKIVKLYNKDNDYFECSIDGEFSRIPYSKILYFESEARKVKIVTVDGDYYTNKNLNEIIEIVPSDNFLMVHRSFIVNFAYLKNYAYEKITMANDDQIGISQSKRKDVRTYFLKRRSNYNDGI